MDPDLDPNCFDTDGIPERTYVLNKLILKISYIIYKTARRHAKLPSMQKKLECGLLQVLGGAVYNG